MLMSAHDVDEDTVQKPLEGIFLLCTIQTSIDCDDRD